MKQFILFPAAALLLSFAAESLEAQIRVGIIGTDTSHVPAFTRLLNDASAPEHVPGAKVVAAYKGGSPDMPNSAGRVDKFAEEIRTKYGVEIVPDIATLLGKVDAVLLESVDGRVHLEQAKQVIAAGKPMFIDKPLAASIQDARAIAKLAAAARAPWFSSSSLRYGKFVEELKKPGITGAVTWGPGPLEDKFPLQYSWYAIHPVEALYALMGPGCVEVTNVSTPQADDITCRWKDGRIGTVRSIRPKSGYGAVVFSEGTAASSSREGANYGQLMQQIVEFFKTKKPPVDNAETMELFEFLYAAQKSKEQGGRPVKLEASAR